LTQKVPAKRQEKKPDKKGKKEESEKTLSSGSKRGKERATVGCEKRDKFDGTPAKVLPNIRERTT